MSKRSKGMAVALLALVLALALSVPAFAATDDSQATAPGAGYGNGNGHGRMMGAGIRGIDVAAKVLGMAVADLAAERQAGKSLADIAAEKNVPTDTLIDEMLKARKTALDAAVASGRITQEQADYMLQNMKDNIADRIDDTEVGPRGGGRGFGGQGMRGAGACGGTWQ